MSADKQLYFGGEICTVDRDHPAAEALAVKEGKIAAVGSKEACRSFLGSAHEAVDLAGCTLLPGFIDTHLHPTLMVFYNLNLNLAGVSTMAGLQEKITLAGKAGRDDAWIVGLQFDDLSLVNERPPLRRDLDAACADRPVILVTFDGHRVIANTRAIEMAGVTADTKDPAGGIIDREPGGYPAGVFREAAAQLMLSKMPFPEMGAIAESADRTFAELTACGITSVGAVLQTGPEGPAGAAGAYDLPLMQMLLDRVPVNLYCLLVADGVAALEAARESELHRPGSEPQRRVGGIKIFSDGALQAGTAFLEEGYGDDPDNRGFLVLSEKEIYARMKEAHSAGFQVAVHAIGDAANGVCLKLYDRLFKERPASGHRHRLEHASVLNPQLIDDIARLGLVVSSQPLFIHSEKSWLQKKLGAARARWTYPYASLLQAGVKLAGASDAPVRPKDVLHAIQCCVTREGFQTEQGIGAAQALRAYTLDAAYAQFEENSKGSLSVGKRADMVVLSQNPLSVPPDQIGAIEVVKTICGGQTVYQA